jgi:CheY-like chemotaxis protein
VPVTPLDQIAMVVERLLRVASDQGVGTRVLLAQDSPDNQALIAHLLRKAGATVAVAPDGQQALEQIEASEPFSLVLMDLQMPCSTASAQCASCAAAATCCP